MAVNVICPTTVQTPMVQPAESGNIPKDLVRRMMKATIPQPWLQPEDVSRGLLYLVTDPGVITGSVLEIGLGGSARIRLEQHAARFRQRGLVGVAPSFPKEKARRNSGWFTMSSTLRPALAILGMPTSLWKYLQRRYSLPQAAFMRC